jgi:uncharacterized membrane protein
MGQSREKCDLISARMNIQRIFGIVIVIGIMIVVVVGIFPSWFGLNTTNNQTGNSTTGSSPSWELAQYVVWGLIVLAVIIFLILLWRHIDSTTE